jgi:hypothetical protein
MIRPLIHGFMKIYVTAAKGTRLTLVPPMLSERKPAAPLT